MRMLARLTAVAVASALALTGCAPAAPQLPSGLRTLVEQSRLDIAANVLVVRVMNGASTPVTVRTIQVRSPLIAAPMTLHDDVVLAQGDTVDFRMPLAAARCSVRPGTAAAKAPAVVRLTVETAGSTLSGDTTPGDPFATFAQVNAAGCLAASTAAVADVALPTTLRTEGAGAAQRAWIDVRITPSGHGDGWFDLARVYGTTILTAEAAALWPVGRRVRATDAPFTLTLPVQPARCDQHAAADDKRGTILPFEITTSDGRSGRLDRPAGPDLKRALLTYVAVRCGYAG